MQDDCTRVRPTLRAREVTRGTMEDLICEHENQSVEKDDWGQLWYVCNDCDAQLDGEPAQDREEALADMRGDE